MIETETNLQHSCDQSELMYGRKTSEGRWNLKKKYSPEISGKLEAGMYTFTEKGENGYFCRGKQMSTQRVYYALIFKTINRKLNPKQLKEHLNVMLK